VSANFAGRLIIAAIAALAIASEGRAQCTGVNHVTWPSVNPVWDFCWLRPQDSTGGNGSGVELRDVRYRGTLILARAHLPILNVKYETNQVGCGGQNFCYRDWLWQEQTFQCSPSPSPGYCTGQSTPASPPPTFCAGGASCTVCDHPGLDAGSFQGVAVEDRGTSLRVTSQCQAGWYRYIPVWEFFGDGRIEVRFVATSIDHTCVAYTHHHQAYFRLDVDVDTSGANFVDEVIPPSSLQRVTVERSFIDTSPARRKWRIGSPGSPYAVEVSRNPEDGAAGDPVTIPNDFPIADGWVLVNNPSEIDDGAALGSNECPVGLNGFDNNQNVNGADIVLWVRAGALHQGEAGGEAADCSMVGPTIKVLPVPVASRLNTVPPCRIVDTRNDPGVYGGPAIPGNGARTFVLTGQCGIPVTAKSVAVNLTVVQASSGGYLTAFPAGQGLPLASTLNFAAGQTRANNAVLSLSAGGAVSVFNGAAGPANFLLDVTGWFE
jgi:hypothetical protein